MCPERWCWVTPLRISEIDPTLIDPIDPGRSESDRSDPVRSDPDRPDPDRSHPDRSSPDRSDPDRFDTDRSDPDRSDPGRSDPIDPTLIDSTLIDQTPIYPNAYLRKLWRNGDAWMRVWERLELLWKWRAINALSASSWRLYSSALGVNMFAKGTNQAFELSNCTYLLSNLLK